MDTQDFARWMREEHTKVEDLAHQLQECIAAIPKTGVQAWLDDLRARFEHIRAHIQKHIALEERDGYMAAVLERRPTLSGEVERLQHEHGEFIQLLNAIHKDLGDIEATDHLLIRDACHRIENFLRYYDHHEASENLIVVSVFTHDIGTKD